MGVENNEAVLMTIWDDKVVDKIREWVSRLPDPQLSLLFAFIPSLRNGRTTIILAPCGSKKYEKTADEIKILRDRLIIFIKTFEHEDGSSPVEWIEVGYGEYGQKVLRGNNKNMYNDKDYAIY